MQIARLFASREGESSLATLLCTVRKTALKQLPLYFRFSEFTDSDSYAQFNGANRTDTNSGRDGGGDSDRCRVAICWSTKQNSIHFLQGTRRRRSKNWSKRNGTGWECDRHLAKINKHKNNNKRNRTLRQRGWNCNNGRESTQLENWESISDGM